MKRMLGFSCKDTGFSMIEVVIAVAIIGIFFASVASVYSIIGKAIMNTRTRTVATNLAQEKIESLKNYSYFRLRVTSDYDFTNYGHDQTYYVPETGILIGNYPYERRMLVQRVKEDSSGNLIEVSPDGGDTGLKKITVTVLWEENGHSKSFSLSNLSRDPNRHPLDCSISGVATDQTTLSAIEGVSVVVVDYLSWNAVTDTVGAYAIKVPSGTYQVRATKDGYWPFTSPAMNVTGAYPCSFTLKQMATATTTGYIFINDHPVISQVVASTITVAGEPLEWVELYNPTTFSWTINSAMFQMQYADNSGMLNTIGIDYFTTTLPPYSYYLIANTGTVTLGSYQVHADARFMGGAYPDIIENGKGGIVISAGPVSDRVGWGNGGSAPVGTVEGTSIASDLFSGQAQVRHSMPGYVCAGRGNAFDSDNNAFNFISNCPISQSLDTFPKNSSALFSTAPISGYPAYGAIITCDDGLSTHATSYMVDPAGYRLAYFQLTQVATGTCTASIFYNGAHGSAFQTVGNIVLSNNGQIAGITNATTTPPWPYAGFSCVIATGVPSVGFVAGTIRCAGTPIARPPETVRIESGASNTSNSGAGDYLLALEPGTHSIVANQNNLNPKYVSQTIDGVTVELGAIASGVDFDIGLGGIATGRVRSDAGDNLPNVLVVAYDLNNNEINSALTGSDGIYVIPNLPMNGNTYTFKPALDSTESSTPASVSRNVAQGSTIWVSTFAVSSAYGTISGAVTYNGAPIDSGALIIVTTATIASLPEDCDYAMRNNGVFYYSTTSRSDGTYSVDVRGGIYTVYAWYSTQDANGVSSPVQKHAYDQEVTPGVTTPGVNFSWP